MGFTLHRGFESRPLRSRLSASRLTRLRAAGAGGRPRASPASDQPAQAGGLADRAPHDAVPGERDDASACRDERGGLLAVPLERVLVVVEGAAIELDDQAPPAPQRVDLVAGDAGVDPSGCGSLWRGTRARNASSSAERVGARRAT